MPPKYKICIEKESDGYRFYVIPPNNSRQPIAKSMCAYQSYNDCNVALEQFKSLVRKHHITEADDHLVRICTFEENGIKRYSFIYFLENGEPICKYPRKYEHKRSCNIGIKAILSAIEQEG